MDSRSDNLTLHIFLPSLYLRRQTTERERKRERELSPLLPHPHPGLIADTQSQRWYVCVALLYKTETKTAYYILNAVNQSAVGGYYSKPTQPIVGRLSNHKNFFASDCVSHVPLSLRPLPKVFISIAGFDRKTLGPSTYVLLSFGHLV